MAHELSIRESGFVEMAYAGSDLPWHGLGQSLTPGSSIETWQKEAGMDWTINSSELVFADQDGDANLFPGKQILYRSDNKEGLSVVSDRYKIVQPKDVLEFFRSLVGEAGMELATAGCLFGGKRFWALADTKNKVILNGGKDPINGFLLLSTSCDGTLATTAQFTATRVVCNNTLTLALGENEKSRITTSHSTVFKPNMVKDKLGLFHTAWDKFSAQMHSMTDVKVTVKDAYNHILAMVANDDADPTPPEVRTANEIHNLFLGGGMGSDIAGRTVFGLLNAMTEYQDHHIGRNASNILCSTFWGNASKNKQAAMEYLVDKYEIA